MNNSTNADSPYDTTSDIFAVLGNTLNEDNSYKLFAILDTASDNALFPTLRSLDSEADYELIFDDTVGAEPSPVVVELDIRSPFLANIIEREKTKHDGDYSLFVSPVPLKNQMTHWRQILFVKDIDSRTLLFRYYDPRVWFGFLEVSLPNERNSCLGPARSLWMHARNDIWIGFSNSSAQTFDEKGTPTVPAIPPIQLRKPHKDAAEYLAELNFSLRLLNYLRDEIPEELENFAPNTAQQMILAGIHRAKLNGLETEDNITAWVQIMFQIAPNFDEQPAIRKALDQCPHDYTDKLDYAIENTTDMDWDKAEDLYDNNAWTI